MICEQRTMQPQRNCIWNFLRSSLAALWLINFASAGPPEGVPDSAQRLTGSGVDKLESWTHEDKLYVVLAMPSGGDSIRLPRLANVLKTIHWLSEPDSKLELLPEPQHWVIKLGDSSPTSASIIEMKFDGPPVIFDPSLVVRPDAENMILLPAKLATTKGENLRYEPQPHKDTVGYWSNPKDTAEWHFAVNTTGLYDIDILQGCGKGHGGSRVEVRIADETLSFEVQETGHFQNFIWRTLGRVRLAETESTSLILVPQTKPAGAVMDVRAMRICPVGSKRETEPQLAAPDLLPKAE